MPTSRIALRRGKSVQYRRAISDAVHKALVEVIGIPAEDQFHLIDEYDAENFIYHPSFLGISRTDDLVIINITLRGGRDRRLRVALHKKIAELLADKPGIRPEDVFIYLVENDYADWSLGNGDAPLMKLLESAEA
jgi:4-oxalocrotonate tautomerase